MSQLIAPNRTNWKISSPYLKYLYTLALVCTKRDLLRPYLTSSFTESMLEFGFNMIQGLDMEEPAAVQIVPTQNRGQFIEHQGCIYRPINIKGTTGLRPNRNRPGAILPITVNTGSTPVVDLNTERTGFDDLVQLINLFRLYYTLKEDSATAPYTTMVWKNGREAEYYVVEPLSFKTSRDSGNPMTTSYDISLRTIGRLENAKIPDILDKAFSHDGFMNRLKEWTQKLNAAYTAVNSLQDLAISSGAKFITNIMQPVNDLLNALTVFGNTSRRISEISKFAVQNMISNADQAWQSFSGLANNYIHNGIIDDFKRLAEHFKNMGTCLRGICAEDQLFGSSATNKVNSKINSYNNSLTTHNGVAADLGAIGNHANSAQVNSGEDIRGVAKRLLGNSNNWKSLVVLNGLKPPYIGADGDGINVLRPGVDSILYPTAGQTPKNSVAPDTTRKSTGKTPRTIYGRDLKLASISEGVFDFELSSSGDLATVEELENMNQAIQIKFNTEQGTLPAHDKFGMLLPFGTRNNSATSFTEFDLQARNTLLSDTRIKTINSLELVSNGNVTNVKASVTLVDGDSTLSTNFDARR